MKKIFTAYLVGFSYALMSTVAFAQTQGSLLVKDANAAPQNLCNVSSSTGSVMVQCADLYVQGAQVNGSNPVPVTASSLPLPTGSATSALQTTGNTSLANIATYLSGTLTVNGSGATQPISASTLPLPTGAATSALQSTQNTSLTSIATAVTNVNTTLGSALPLPTGAATAANQTTANTSLSTIASTLSGTLTTSFASTPTVNVGTTAAPSAGARHFPGCTVGTSSGTCLAASTAVNFLQAQNTSATATVSCTFGATAVLNSSTSFQLSPGQSAAWGPNTYGVPTGALNCISSVASTPVFIEWN